MSNNGPSSPADQRYPTWHRFPLSISVRTRSSQPPLGQLEFASVKKIPAKVLSCLNQEISVLKARSINEVYDALAERLLSVAALISEPHSKYIVGLAGPPGAGKSTLAAEVVNRLNLLWPSIVSTAPGTDSEVEPPTVATVLPMDGFHLYRSQLDKMEDPEEAHARRGAPWTFDPERLLTCLKTLRSQGFVFAPSFDHGIGDPVEDNIFVSLQHKVVIVEGNYILMGDGVWREICSLFDQKWFIEVDMDTAMQRVQRRHVRTGKAPDIAKWRIEYNDRPNAELITKSKKNADLVIKSVDM
ncbi:putative uridine kinase C227.14 isoform X2 [Aristolochia californica]|uniref:putative uridine kinase C227.14 isoform X2 n=1 Tax=Aristolochia californica TaxID=171875 RepID=UPI0035E09FEB